MRNFQDVVKSEEYYKAMYRREKKEKKILIRAIFDLSKVIRKLKKQENFLNELLDEYQNKLRDSKT